MAHTTSVKGNLLHITNLKRTIQLFKTLMGVRTENMEH